MDKKLYLYNSNTKNWELLGSGNVKKVEGGFFLMNDGTLYHKGSAVSGITENHTVLTRIFLPLTFADFTYSFDTNTLVALRI